MRNLVELIETTAGYFADKEVENPRLNAELIFSHALGCGRLDLYLQYDRPLDEKTLARIRPLVRRRACGEPIQYIFGCWEFDGLMLRVDRRALIPRPETEELASLLVEVCRPPPERILDLGTGSGAIAVALANRWRESRVTAVDLDPGALQLARENALQCGLEGRFEWMQSDWFAAVTGRFGLIVANPPYLSVDEWESAQPEVREHEPRQALVAENGGRADLERIIADAPAFLEPSGCLALETGVGHHPALAEAARERGYGTWKSRKDISGRDRFFLLFAR
jgi:release factor glutamine methyltransferase